MIYFCGNLNKPSCCSWPLVASSYRGQNQSTDCFWQMNQLLHTWAFLTGFDCHFDRLPHNLDSCYSAHLPQYPHPVPISDPNFWLTFVFKRGSSCHEGRVVTRVELSRGSSCHEGRVVSWVKFFVGRVVCVELSQGWRWLTCMTLEIYQWNKYDVILWLGCITIKKSARYACFFIGFVPLHDPNVSVQSHFFTHARG